jgi:hypothetical protein
MMRAVPSCDFSESDGDPKSVTQNLVGHTLITAVQVDTQDHGPIVIDSVGPPSDVVKHGPIDVTCYDPDPLYW